MGRDISINKNGSFHTKDVWRRSLPLGISFLTISDLTWEREMGHYFFWYNDHRVLYYLCLWGEAMRGIGLRQVDVLPVEEEKNLLHLDL